MRFFTKKLFRFYVWRELGQTTVYLNYQRAKPLSLKESAFARTEYIRDETNGNGTHGARDPAPSKPVVMDGALSRKEAEKRATKSFDLSLRGSRRARRNRIGAFRFGAGFPGADKAVERLPESAGSRWPELRRRNRSRNPHQSRHPGHAQEPRSALGLHGPQGVSGVQRETAQRVFRHRRANRRPQPRHLCA